MIWYGTILKPTTIHYSLDEHFGWTGFTYVTFKRVRRQNREVAPPPGLTWPRADYPRTIIGLAVTQRHWRQPCVLVWNDMRTDRVKAIARVLVDRIKDWKTRHWRWSVRRKSTCKQSRLVGEISLVYRLVYGDVNSTLSWWTLVDVGCCSGNISTHAYNKLRDVQHIVMPIHCLNDPQSRVDSIYTGL
jgi:hypothetical protein